MTQPEDNKDEFAAYMFTHALGPSDRVAKTVKNDKGENTSSILAITGVYRMFNAKDGDDVTLYYLMGVNAQDSAAKGQWATENSLLLGEEGYTVLPSAGSVFDKMNTSPKKTDAFAVSDAEDEEDDLSAAPFIDMN
jgi:hypothetical protein